MCVCVGDPGNKKMGSYGLLCFFPLGFSFVFQSYFVYNTVQVNGLFKLHWECLIKDKLQYPVY